MGDSTEAWVATPSPGTCGQFWAGLGFPSWQRGKPRTFAGLLVLASGLGTVPCQGSVLALQLLNVLAVGLERGETSVGQQVPRGFLSEVKPWTGSAVQAGSTSKFILQEGPGDLWDLAIAAEVKVRGVGLRTGPRGVAESRTGQATTVLPWSRVESGGN